VNSIYFTFYNKKEFEGFLDSLSDKDAQKLLVTIQRVTENGLLLSGRMQLIKKLENNLYEIRSKFANNSQRVVYFKVEGSHFVITHGFTKKTQKMPLRELERAKRLRTLYFERKRKNHGRH